VKKAEASSSRLIIKIKFILLLDNNSVYSIHASNQRIRRIIHIFEIILHEFPNHGIQFIITNCFNQKAAIVRKEKEATAFTFAFFDFAHLIFIHIWIQRTF